MEQVDLRRYKMTGRLGSGADYEVRSAVDLETGQQVVLKRPEPMMVQRQLHAGIEARTDRTLQVRTAMALELSTLVPLRGYTERANHDGYFDESLGQEYRVLVEARAAGIPLMGDIRAGITGVPIGLGQHLFALYPLMTAEACPPFAIHRQLLELEDAFCSAGYMLLDLRPHNIFYQPASGQITVIDCGDLTDLNAGPSRRGQPARDIHNFYLEMLKYYTTPQPPPSQARGYRTPYGLRPVIHFERELAQMAHQFKSHSTPQVQDAILPLLDQVSRRAYTSFNAFQGDLLTYLSAASEAHRTLPSFDTARAAWRQALEWLHGDYWRGFLFDPTTELAGFATV